MTQPPDELNTVQLPGPRQPDLSEQCGIRQPVDPETLHKIEMSMSNWVGPGSESRPAIVITNRQLRELTEEFIEALLPHNNPPRLFHSGGQLARIVRDDTGRLRIEFLKVDGVRHLMSHVADWMRETNQGLKSTNPPVVVAKDLLVREWDELPALTGIITAPTLRPDGTLLDQPGYDPATGLYLDPDGLLIPALPEHPTDDDVAAARDLLLGDLLGDFAFVDEASRANALAMVLTIGLRDCVPGLVPMALIDAPVMGSGKTFLVNIAALIATGRPARLTAAPTDNDEELRKRITAILLQGEKIIVFDNLSTTLTSSLLSQALTSNHWSDRILGYSQMMNIEPHVTWVTTGNNITLGGDLPRRCYPIKLDPKVAQPWKREFQRPNLDEWVLENRGRLLGAILTLARAWFDRGRPTDDAPQWGSYQPWTRMMHGIMSVARVPGFLDNLSELTEATDEESLGWLRLLTACREHFGQRYFASAEMAVYLQFSGIELPPTLAASLGMAKDGQMQASRLAKRLRTIVGRRWNETGLRLERGPEDGHTKSARWRLVIDE